MTANTYGRQVVVPLTNKSGGGVIAGDVVVIDTTNNDAFTTTTAAGFTGGVGIAQETIASNAVGRVLLSGYAALVLTSASVTRGNFGKTHTVAKQAVDAGATRGVGTFCQFLTGGTTSDAIVYPVDLLGSSLTNPMTTKGDIIQGDTGGTPVRLAAGASGQVLTAGGAGAFSAWAVAATQVVSENTMAGDVTMTNANTFYDGPSLTPAAGKYFFIGKVVCLNNSALVDAIQAKLWDGTTTIDETFEDVAAGIGPGGDWFLTVMGTFTTNGSTAVKISCAGARAGWVIKQNVRANSATSNKASRLECWPCS